MKIENEKIAETGLNEELKKFLTTSHYTIGDFTFEVDSRILSYKDQSTKLTRKETYLLVILAANINKLVDRKYLLNTIWESDTYRNTRSMDVYTCKLRKLLTNDPKIYLINIHNQGYKLIAS